jgi:hypothetical protein
MFFRRHIRGGTVKELNGCVSVLLSIARLWYKYAGYCGESCLGIDNKMITASC